MRFVLFTEKSVAQCMKALNERMQAKESKSRPALEGWIEKNGRFSIAVSSQVYGRFSRTTRLTGVAERDEGITVIRGFVPNGLSREGMAILFVGLALLAVLMLTQGQVIFSIALLILSLLLSIPLIGDYRNHDVLLNELERTLKTRKEPPVRTSAAKRS